MPQEIQKISLNKAYLNQNNILSEHPNSNGLGWLCGDYFYYVFSENVIADYYWLIEPDVAFTFDNLSDFFAKFQTATQDAVLYNFAKAPESWAWTARAKVIHNDVYQAFFPLSRLSFRAISACKSERQKITDYFHKNNLNLSQYPNDESLVVTAVLKHKLSVEPLNKFWPDSFKYFSYRNAILGDNGKNILPVNQVIHPFRQPEYLGGLLSQVISPIPLTESMLDFIHRSTLGKEDIDRILKSIQKQAFKDITKALERRCNSLIP
ncbi:hypothetical protein FHQ28_06925, partial [Pasteurellaceae bacterium USgator11]